MKRKSAEEAFQGGCNCAQAVLLPFSREAGLTDEAAMKLASSFGGGIGRTQETCGAVTGGCMAIGLKHGFARADDQMQKEVALSKTREFLESFKEEFGSLKCRELLNCDLNTEEGRIYHRDQNQREQICQRCVGFAAQFIETL